MKRDAIAILQRAAVDVVMNDDPGSRMTLMTLQNAVGYLLFGDITGKRGVANFWANWPIGE